MPSALCRMPLGQPATESQPASHPADYPTRPDDNRPPRRANCSVFVPSAPAGARHTRTPTTAAAMQAPPGGPGTTQRKASAARPAAGPNLHLPRPAGPTALARLHPRHSSPPPPARAPIGCTLLTGARSRGARAGRAAACAAASTSSQGPRCRRRRRALASASLPRDPPGPSPFRCPSLPRVMTHRHPENYCTAP